MRVSIHQPHYLPWLPYLGKIVQSDIFILLDDVEFTRNGWQNRNKIKTAQGPLVLTVPVKHKLGQWIQQVEVSDQSWRKKHWASFQQAYRKAPYFEQYRAELEAFWSVPWQGLSQPCCSMIEWLLQKLEVAPKVLRSSQLQVESRSSQRLVQLVKAAGGSGYLSGRHALQAYLDPHVFEPEGLELTLFDWSCPAYPQLHGEEFLSNLAALDALLNLGPKKTLQIAREGGRVERFSSDKPGTF